MCALFSVDQHAYGALNCLWESGMPDSTNKFFRRLGRTYYLFAMSFMFAAKSLIMSRHKLLFPVFNHDIPENYNPIPNLLTFGVPLYFLPMTSGNDVKLASAFLSFGFVIFVFDRQRLKNYFNSIELRRKRRIINILPILP